MSCFRGDGDGDEQVHSARPWRKQEAGMALPALVGRKPVAALGKFDGLHAGHKAIANAASALGDANLVRLTQVHEALGIPESTPIVEYSDRRRVLKSWCCVAAEVELPLPRVMALSPEEFVDSLVHMGAIGVCAGSDFRFGKGRSGDASSLQRIASARGLTCDVVPITLESNGDHKAASSSRVRELLAAGKPAAVSSLLHRPHRLVLHKQKPETTESSLSCAFIALNLVPSAGEYRAVVLAGDGDGVHERSRLREAAVSIDEDGHVFFQDPNDARVAESAALANGSRPKPCAPAEEEPSTIALDLLCGPHDTSTASDVLSIQYNTLNMDAVAASAYIH